MMRANASLEDSWSIFTPLERKICGGDLWKRNIVWENCCLLGDTRMGERDRRIFLM